MRRKHPAHILATVASFYSTTKLELAAAYDLEVVDHSKIVGEDYYTLSCSGITHFLGSSSDFTPLEQWEREYLLFNKMRKKPFFRVYRAWKNFTVWKKNVKAAKIATASEGITTNLFFFVPALRDALFKVKSECVNIGERRLFDFVEETTYTLDQFVDAQQAIQEDLTVTLNEFSTDVHDIVRGACDEIVDQFLHAVKNVCLAIFVFRQTHIFNGSDQRTRHTQ